jgi:hypothetical protein
MTPGGSTRYDPNDPELSAKSGWIDDANHIQFLRDVLAGDLMSDQQRMKIQAELDALTQAAEVARWKCEDDSGNHRPAHDDPERYMDDASPDTLASGLEAAGYGSGGPY